jgi:hypothetical protein
MYQRWPTLDDLLVDALMEWSHDAFPAQETGNIETDLLALGRQLADVLNRGVGARLSRWSSRLASDPLSCAKPPDATSTTGRTGNSCRPASKHRRR